MNATPFTAPAAGRVIDNLFAAPNDRVTVLSTAGKPVAVAVKVFATAVPVSFTFLPMKSATPATAFMATSLPINVPPMVALDEVSFTNRVESVTVFPSSSLIVTTGWVPKTVSLTRVEETTEVMWCAAPKVRVKS